MPPSPRPIRRLPLRLAALAGLLFPLAACVIGPDRGPGCHADADCDPGWSCDEGACFHVTTGASPPRDPGDGGDAG